MSEGWDVVQATSPVFPHNPAWGPDTWLSYMVEAIVFLRPSFHLSGTPHQRPGTFLITRAFSISQIWRLLLFLAAGITSPHGARLIF